MGRDADGVLGREPHQLRVELRGRRVALHVGQVQHLLRRALLHRRQPLRPAGELRELGGARGRRGAARAQLRRALVEEAAQLLGVGGAPRARRLEARALALRLLQLDADRAERRLVRREPRPRAQVRVERVLGDEARAAARLELVGRRDGQPRERLEQRAARVVQHVVLERRAHRPEERVGREPDLEQQAARLPLVLGPARRVALRAEDLVEQRLQVGREALGAHARVGPAREPRRHVPQPARPLLDGQRDLERREPRAELGVDRAQVLVEPLEVVVVALDAQAVEVAARPQRLEQRRALDRRERHRLRVLRA